MLPSKHFKVVLITAKTLKYMNLIPWLVVNTGWHKVEIKVHEATESGEEKLSLSLFLNISFNLLNISTFSVLPALQVALLLH